MTSSASALAADPALDPEISAVLTAARAHIQRTPTFGLTITRESVFARSGIRRASS